MPRRARIAPDGVVYHTLNRANGRNELFAEAQADAEVEALRRCVHRGTPYGSENWTTLIVAALGLRCTLHPRGRPRKLVGLADT
jgi:hypothetical protein